jgi:hypothetical protein
MRGIYQHFPSRRRESARREELVTIVTRSEKKAGDVVDAGLGESAYWEDRRIEVEGHKPAE